MISSGGDGSYQGNRDYGPRGIKRQSVNKIFSGEHRSGAPPRMPIRKFEGVLLFIHISSHKMTNFQLGASGGAMGIQLYADLYITNNISKTSKIIQNDVL
jgi:hypothetical protein